jgi:CYTH domain-containing protein/thymidylate kinase
MQNNPVFMIAVTGGPCGGKSTFLAKVYEWLQGFGIQAILVSETATELISAGITPSLIGIENFEEMLIGYQLQREETYLSAGKKIIKNHPVAILCDRGAMDCAAYIEKGVFLEISQKLGHSFKDLMNRYKMVVHLTTAAIGAEEFYTLQNNSARSESIEEARILDGKTQQAWLGHPHHIIIDNRTGFDAKMLRALQSLARVLNMPEPTENERKFKVLNFNPNSIPKEAVALNITQDYLVSDGEIERRVRISELDGQETFFYTEKRETGEIGSRYERETVITQERYQELYAERDMTLNTIKKIRHCFFYGGRKFEQDVYLGPAKAKGLVVLEVEVPKMDEKIELPSWLDLQEITGVKEYKNRSLAEKP